ncbi:MAG: hypothetical protein V5B32_00605 [Candidatus Accumulibacter sp. UW26]|jgi:hypothetical protein
MFKLPQRSFFSSSIPLALCAGVTLVACATPYSEAPIATSFTTTRQLKLQAGSHWNAIAEHAAGSLMESLRLGKGCIAPQLECERIYVRGPAQPSDFAQAFRTQFITSLVKSGVTVARNPGGAIEVDFDIQVVKFSPHRPDGTFNSATVIFGGLWALEGLWVHTSPGAAGALALAAFDANRWLTSELAAGPIPQHEVIVTVSASDATRYLGRTTNVYYVADTDQMLYRTPAVLSTISVSGGE